ncbi:MAG TPA: 50S ribosomal protein L11 methyltransferase [Trueperaceae bacterium]|nr:50S ribosomal protein L11 methyltransferase [Trueperaceae bacterium]
MNVFRLECVDGESAAAAALWTLGCQGLIEELLPDGTPVLLAFFAERIDLPMEGTWETRPDVDYLAEYQAGLAPVRVGHLVVAPSHATVTATDGDLIIWLDPGSAFGTGHHETTAMALAALVEAQGGMAGRSVLDVGSGSGLLAIAADRLGAESSYGVDVDPLTVPVARENAARNRSRAKFSLGSLDAPGLPTRFDVVVANLYAELHATLFSAYADRLLGGGIAYLTGILASLRTTVTSAAPAEMRLVDERHDGEWLLLTYQKQSGAR